MSAVEPNSIDKPVLAMIGPTAIGKTELSLLVAEKFQCEIISVDSMQVYRFMDIGTSKVRREEQARIPHHLIDIVNPDEDYDAGCFIRDATNAIREIHQRGRVPLLTGGTGLYLRALTEGLAADIGRFPEIRSALRERIVTEGCEKLHEELFKYDCISAQKININDRHRILRALEIYQGTGKSWSEHICAHQQYKSNSADKRFSNILQIGLTTDRNSLYQRIDIRTQLMFAGGLEEEVRGLLAKGYSPHLKSMQAIGYRHINQYISNQRDKDETQRLLARDTRRYAKRQYTWFHAIQDILWLAVEDREGILRIIEQWMVKA